MVLFNLKISLKNETSDNIPITSSLQDSFLIANNFNEKTINFPVDTGRKLNVQKTSLNVLFTFNFCPVSAGLAVFKLVRNIFGEI